MQYYISQKHFAFPVCVNSHSEGRRESRRGICWEELQWTGSGKREGWGRKELKVMSMYKTVKHRKRLSVFPDLQYPININF